MATLSERRQRDPDLREQQRDHLCGPFCAARLLRDAGFAVDEDDLARRAGTVLPDRPISGAIPPGAVSLADFPEGLATGPPECSGTAAGALAEAIEAFSYGALRCVGIHGEWTGPAVQHLVEQSFALGVHLLANLRTGLLWGSRPPVSALLSQLKRGSAPAIAPDWDAGHFVELRSVLRGPGGALAVVRDTYPTLGAEGYHLQPPGALAAALRRDDGRAGGVLAISAPATAVEVQTLTGRLGLQNGIWDNGTRFVRR